VKIRASEPPFTLPETRSLVAYVLCTGVDPALMATRKLLLERAGHTVFIARDEHELTSACRQIRFDVAVIGQAVPTATKEEIAAAIRESCPGVKILELFSPHQGKRIEAADSWLEVPADVPEEFAARVNELARKKERKQA
jgi:DNA-binding response OmpR family regulator